MKKLSLLTVSMALFMVACGDDSSSGVSNNTTSKSDMVVDAYDDLPVCSDKRSGATAYIKEEKVAYVCENNVWEKDKGLSSSVDASDLNSISSSVENQSSSSISAEEVFSNDYLLNPAIKYDSIIDNRDNQVYKTVQIGDQVWMAENLNYEIEGKSWCYNDSALNCAVFGRLYAWDVAMEACPAGWHLPSTEEFDVMISFIGERMSAGIELKALTSWDDYKGKSGNGSDSYGFSAVSAGYKDKDKYYKKGADAFFWNATEYDGENSKYLYLGSHYDAAGGGSKEKTLGFSVRCVKD